MVTCCTTTHESTQMARSFRNRWTMSRCIWTLIRHTLAQRVECSFYCFLLQWKLSIQYIFKPHTCLWVNIDIPQLNNNNNNNNNKVFMSGHAHKSKMYNRSNVSPEIGCSSTGSLMMCCAAKTFQWALINSDVVNVGCIIYNSAERRPLLTWLQFVENVKAIMYLGNTTAWRKRSRTKRYNEESCHAGWHTPNTGISSKATLPLAWRDRCTTPVCCQLWQMVQNNLAAAQTNMERSMLNITYKDRKTNTWVRKRTQVVDIISNVRKMKCSWAGHINRLKDDRCTSRVTTWRPCDKKIRQGRPAKRWRDDLDKYWSDTIWQGTT